MKVALVHDQLREFGGAERVLVMIKQVFPDADVFTSTYDANSLGEHKLLVKDWNVKVSWFGKIPFINKLYSPLRFLTPLIWESFDFSGYDLVISSTGSWMCKGIKTKKPTLHISYIHHPPRYLYGYETAIEWQKHLPIKIYGLLINHFLRMWDLTASGRPDHLLANSQETRERIRKFYRRDSVVLYPPVLIPQKPDFDLKSQEKTFITVSRLARAKHIDLLIKGANKFGFKLKIVGTGRDMQYLKSIAGPTVQFMGNLTDEELKKAYASSSAFLFASIDEEFGIAPVEAMGYGLPVIAYSSGGLKETVHEGVNGYLYGEQNEDALYNKIKKLMSLTQKEFLQMRKNSRKEAEKYTEEVFKNKLREIIRNV